jgi:hypothetical protein
MHRPDGKVVRGHVVRDEQDERDEREGRDDRRPGDGD